MSPLVHIEKPEFSKLAVRKSRGALTVGEVFEAFRKHDVNVPYILFIQKPEFDGYLGRDERITNVKLYSATTFDHCPVCEKAMEAMQESVYQDGYNCGYEAGLAAASANRT
jgi:hypothetical protein